MKVEGRGKVAKEEKMKLREDARIEKKKEETERKRKEVVEFENKVEIENGKEVTGMEVESEADILIEKEFLVIPEDRTEVVSKTEKWLIAKPEITIRGWNGTCVGNGKRWWKRDRYQSYLEKRSILGRWY